MAFTLSSVSLNHLTINPLIPQINAAKRDAFFRAGGDGPTTKFDPSSRYGGGGGGHDRERLINKKEDNR